MVQKQYTSDLIFDGPAIVSWISQCVTLTPGDVIYTGTPGHTSRMNEGDAVEVDIEGIGVLRNRIALRSLTASRDRLMPGHARACDRAMHNRLEHLLHPLEQAIRSKRLWQETQCAVENLDAHHFGVGTA